MISRKIMPELVADNLTFDEAEKMKNSPSSTKKSVLSFQKISFTVPAKAKDANPKKILQGISATVVSGRVLAIMGERVLPSMLLAAGKQFLRTFLNFSKRVAVGASESSPTRCACV